MPQEHTTNDGRAVVRRKERSIMRAMILTQTGAPLEPADLPCPSPGPSEILIHVSAAGRQDRPPRRRRRIGVTETAAGSGARDRRPGDGSGKQSHPLQDWRLCRRAMARMGLRHLRILPPRPGGPLRKRALHRLPARLCRTNRGLADLDTRDRVTRPTISPRGAIRPMPESRCNQGGPIQLDEWDRPNILGRFNLNYT